MRKSTKATIDDGCSPELVAGADFDLPLGIPIIHAPKKIIIPAGITPFSERNRADVSEEAIGFHEKDMNFADVLKAPQDFVEDFSRFKMLISPDCSLFRDAPLSIQLTNVYRNRAIGSYYQRQGINIIPQVRWGNEYTYTTNYFPDRIAFLGVEKQSIVAIGTYGCIRTKDDRYHFSAGLDAMMDFLEPKWVLVYGNMPDSIFERYKAYANFCQYPDWISRKHHEK